MLDGVDPVQALATLAVIYAAFKLVHYVATSPVIPSVWVPLEAGEFLKILPFIYLYVWVCRLFLLLLLCSLHVVLVLVPVPCTPGLFRLPCPGIALPCLVLPSLRRLGLAW